MDGESDCWGQSSDVGLRNATCLARRALSASATMLISFASNLPVAISASGGEANDVRFVPLLALCGEIVASGRPVLRADVGAGHDAIRAFVGVPVRLASDVVVGVLCATDMVARDWDDDDLEMLTEIAAGLRREVALGLEAALRAAAETELRVTRSRLRSAAHDVARLVFDRRAAGGASGHHEALLRLHDELARLAEAAPPRSDPKTPTLLEPAANGAWPADGTGGVRILLADDLDLNRKLIADMLAIDGHSVDCVADGAAAVRAVEAKRYDLILMDMIMPEMDGIAATRAIRAMPAPACTVPIVALTANTFRDQLNNCLEAGMNAALTKPMSLDALTDTVAIWTRGRNKAA